MSYIVALDPSTAIAGRTELNLNEGAIRIEHSGVDWGDAQIKPYVAEGRYGESVISYRVPNRTITIPLGLGMGRWTVAQEEAARRELQQKVALIQRQGGILLRQRPGQERLYADIMTASLTIPDVYGEIGGVEDKIMLKLECLPDFYGDEIECDAVEGVGQIDSVVQLAAKPFVVPGDYPARTRIVLTEKATQDQKGLLWGFRSTFYSSAAEAALFFDAKDLTPINGAKAEAQAGTFSGQWLILSVPEPGVWHPFMTTDLVTGAKPLTHLGSYRVWARIASSGSSVRLAWSNDDATAPIYNPSQYVAFPNSWAIVDLGEIRIEEPPTGEHWWRGVLQANSTGAAIAVDRIWLQPIDDGAGVLRATAEPSSTLLGPKRLPQTGASIAPAEPPSFIPWNNPVGPFTAGGSANVILPSKATSRQLALTNYGFAIPAGVTIKGIEILPQFQVTGGGVQGPQATFSVGIYKGAAFGAFVGNAKSALVEGTSSVPMGGPNDLWGTALTPAEANGGVIGVVIQAVTFAPKEVTAYVLYPFYMRLYYSYSASAITDDSVLYSTRKMEMRFDGGFRQDTTTNAYVPVSDLHGDLARIPPSGLEKRPVELLVKNSRGTLVASKADGGIDKMRAQVFVRPCYIGRI